MAWHGMARHAMPCRHADIQTDRQRDKQTDRHTHIHTYMQTYIHTDRQTNMQTCMHTYMHACLDACIHTCMNIRPLKVSCKRKHGHGSGHCGRHIRILRPKISALVLMVVFGPMWTSQWVGHSAKIDATSLLQIRTWTKIFHMLFSNFWQKLVPKLEPILVPKVGFRIKRPTVQFRFVWIQTTCKKRVTNTGSKFGGGCWW